MKGAALARAHRNARAALRLRSSAGARVWAIRPHEPLPEDYDEVRGDRLVSVEIIEDGPRDFGRNPPCRLRRIGVMRSQFESFFTDEEDTSLIGGLGSGKSHALADYLVFRIITEPGTDHIVGMSSIPHARKVVIPAINKAFERWGLVRGRDFTWYEERGNSPEITVRMNGKKSTVWIVSLSNHDGLRGMEPATLLVDEARDCPAEGLMVARNRVRKVEGSTVTLRTRASTTPNGYDANWEHYDGGDAKEVRRWQVTNRKGTFNVVVFEREVKITLTDDAGKARETSVRRRYVNCDTDANQFIGSDYGASLTSSMDAQRLLQEKRGQFVVPSTIVARAFTRAHNVRPVTYDPQLPILMGQDFNRGKNATILAQLHELFDDHGHRTGKLKLKVFREIKAQDTFDTARLLAPMFPKKRIECWPDPAGSQRTANSDESSHDILMARVPGLIIHTISEWGVKNGVDHLNGKLLDGDGFAWIEIDPSCTELILDCGQVRWAKNGKDIHKVHEGPDAERTHFLDALLYLVWAKLPHITPARTGLGKGSFVAG